MLMNSLQIFNNAEFGSIRTVTIDNEPWFVGKDVAEALGYSNTKDAIATHVDPEDKQLIQRSENTTFEIPNRGLTLINESGLYALIFGSKLPSARKFKHWVTSEVLPAIRKSGHYEAPGYAPKATSIGEVVNLIKITRQTMREQGATPTEIAEAVKQICEQFGVNLPQHFVKPQQTGMKDVFSMIDFIYQQPRGRGKAKPTYEDFIIHQALVKGIGIGQ